MSETIGKAGFHAYQSPIELIADKVRMEQDEYIVKCVQKMGINVDRDELIRALQYDRDQYEKGYADGRWARDSEIVRCRDCEFYYEDEKWCRRLGVIGAFGADDYCSHGERSEDDMG